MSERPTHRWCPACKEESAVDFDQRCLWCGRLTEQQHKRGGWKRPDLRGSRYTEAQLRALHIFHLRDGISLNQLAKRTFDTAGYKSPGSAATAISREWKRLGLRARDRIEQTVLSSTKHGRGGRDRDEGAYRRWFKRTHGLYRPTCKSTKRQSPRKGEPCTLPAMEGSDFCQAHDPERQEEIRALTARMRAKQPPQPMVPMLPFAAYVKRRWQELGSLAVTAQQLGLHPSALAVYARGLGTDKQPKPTIQRATVERVLEQDGLTTFEELYAAERTGAIAA